MREQLLDLLDLAGAEVEARMHPVAVLDRLPDHGDPRRPQQLAQLGEIVALVEDGDQERPLLRPGGSLLVVCGMPFHGKPGSPVR